MAARYRVLMVGGPHDGRLFDYNTPLPAVLVFQGRFGDDEHITVENYRRQPGTRRYIHQPCDVQQVIPAPGGTSSTNSAAPQPNTVP